MASRKEEKERLRQAREQAEARERAQERKRLILGYAVAGVITAVVAAGIIAVIVSGGDGDGGGDREGFASQVGAVPEGAVLDDREGTDPPPVENGDLDASAAAANCDLELDLPDEGNSHFGDEAREPNWQTNPPTSGDHFGSPTEVASGALAEGPYLEMPPLSRAVHALEHGRVHLHYSPDLPEDDQLALKGLYDADPTGLILSPNDQMPFAVAATAWRQLLGCEEYEGGATLDAVRNFAIAFRGRGPEAVPLAAP